MPREKPKVTLFLDETADRLLSLPGVSERPTPVGASSANKGFQKEEQYEVLTVKITSNDDNGYYTGDEVILDNTDGDAANHDFADQDQLRKSLKIFETSRDAGVSVDTIVKVTPELSEEEREVLWTFTRGGGGDTVLINLKSYDSGNNVFTADIVTSTTDSTPITTNVKARPFEGAVNNSTLVGKTKPSSYTEQIDFGSGDETVYFFLTPTLV